LYFSFNNIQVNNIFLIISIVFFYYIQENYSNLSQMKHLHRHLLHDESEQVVFEIFTKWMFHIVLEVDLLFGFVLNLSLLIVFL